jgi:acyl dehydratase
VTVTRLAIQLGVPVFPGHTLTYTGEVTAVGQSEGVGLIEISLRASSDLGDHVTGTAEVRLPVGIPD